jgi:hypothetical protein
MPGNGSRPRDGKIVATAATRTKLGEALGDADDPATLKLRLEAGVRIRSNYSCPKRALR